ncbi:MAG: sugar ABC transporter permease [Treponema sp.]|jgi:raffinose/stachyose/melibiose transport system permease protein|nr:sugar ABC transporter permease [Treponema sp.]
MHKNKPRLRKIIVSLIFLLPAFAFLSYSVYIPFGWNIVLSFQNWDGFLKKSWAGLANYFNAFHDPEVLKALGNSIFLALVSTLGSVLLGVLAAGLLFKVRRGEGAFYRLIIFMPVMLPSAIVGLLFTFVFNADIGLLNSFFRAVGLGSLTKAWLENYSTVMWCIAFVNIWKMTGLTMMLVFAAIQMLPVSIFESSKIDGASYPKQFFYLTLPLVKSIIQLSTVYILAVCFKTYDIVFSMTRGGPGIASTTIPITMIKTAFLFGEFGYSSAMGIILMLIVVVLVLTFNKLLSGEKYEF